MADVEVRRVFALFGFKTDKKSADRVEKSVQNIKRGVAIIAGAFVSGKVVQGISRLVQETAALGDSVDKVSEKLGINSQALQELRFAAGQTGVQQRTLDMALQRFARRTAEAAQGTGEAKDALAQMGIQLKDSQGRLRPVESLFGDVAEAMSKTKGDGDRLRLAFKLFDSEGAALVNTLKNGRGALDALRKTARETGGVMDKDLIKLSVDLTDTQAEFGLALQGVKNIIAKQLLPFFIKSKRGMIDWIKQNQAWLRTRFVEGIQKVIQVGRNLARFFGRIAKVTREWFDSLSPIATILLKITGIALALAAIMLLPGGAILLLGLLIAAIIDDFETWREGGQSVIGDLIGSLDDLKAAFPGVAAAIEDITRQFTTAIEFIERLWDGLANFIGDVMTTGIIDAIKNNLPSLQTFIADLGTFLLGEFINSALKKLRGVLAIGDFLGLVNQTTATAPAAAGGGATTNTATASVGNVRVNVNVGPGADPAETGRQVGQAARDAMSDVLAEASQNFVVAR